MTSPVFENEGTFIFQNLPPRMESTVNSWENLFILSGIDKSTASVYSKLFDENDLTLDMIYELEHELLGQIGIWKLGHRIRILRMKKEVILKDTGECNYSFYLLIFNI